MKGVNNNMILERIKKFKDPECFISNNDLIPYFNRDIDDAYTVCLVRPKGFVQRCILMNTEFADSNKLDIRFTSIVRRSVKGVKEDFMDDDIFGILNMDNKEDKLYRKAYLRLSSPIPGQHKFNRFVAENINDIIRSYEDCHDGYYLIAARNAYSKDPDDLTVEQYNAETNMIIDGMGHAGYICINEFCGFEGSLPFIYNDKYSSPALINLFKRLLSDEHEKVVSFKKKNTPLKDGEFVIYSEGGEERFTNPMEYFYNTYIVGTDDDYYQSSNEINIEFDKFCKEINYIPPKKYAMVDYLVNVKGHVKEKKPVDIRTGKLCKGESYIAVYKGILLK